MESIPVPIPQDPATWPWFFSGAVFGGALLWLFMRAVLLPKINEQIVDLKHRVVTLEAALAKEQTELKDMLRTLSLGQQAKNI